MKRLLPVAAALSCLLLVAGCGNKHHEGEVIQGDTEGIYVNAGELTYQVQISRQLNPNDPEDAAYLSGYDPEDIRTAPDETLFGVFMRVENETKEPHPAASEFRIIDTQENEYTPIMVDPAENPFAYDPIMVAPGDRIPDPDSINFQGPVQGSLILFKITLQSIADRPLEFEIDSPTAPRRTATVALDV